MPRADVGDEGGTLHAVNAADGSVKWKAVAPLPPATKRVGAFDQSPSVWGGLVFIGNTNGVLYAFKAATGALVWQYATSVYERNGGTVPITAGTPSGAAAAISSDGLLYFGAYNVMYALDATTGIQKWNRSVDDGEGPSGHLVAGCCGIYSSPALADGWVYYGHDAGEVTCLNASTGALAWSTEPDPWAKTPNSVDSGCPALHGNPPNPVRVCLMP